MRYKNKYSKYWVKRFALLPKNVNGVSVWLGYYVERYVEKTDKQCGCGCHCSIVGWWERDFMENI